MQVVCLTTSVGYERWRAAMVTADGYTIDKELVLTREMHLSPVIPELVEAAGFIEHPEPEVLLLTMLMISGCRYGGDWKVNALVNNEVVGSIWCKPGSDRDSVLEVVDTWIRASDHITFVPGRVHDISSTDPGERPYFVHGIVLVRGDQL